MARRYDLREFALFARSCGLLIALTACGEDGPSQIPYGWGAAGIGGMHASGTGGSAQATGGSDPIAGTGAGQTAAGNGGSAGTTGGAGAGAAGDGGDSGSAGLGGSGGMETEATGGSDATTGGTGGTGGDEPEDPPEIGTGDIEAPVEGPAPARAADVGGEPFVLVKNWDFGTSGSVRDQAALIAEFQFQDQFGTIASGTSYGAVTVAPTEALAITAADLGLPGDMQPVDDDAERPYRELNADSLKAYVRPLSSEQTMVSTGAHNAGNGSLIAKWKLPRGGSQLGRDMIWETRIRMPKPAAGYWLGLWASGNKWSVGPELNVLQAFGAEASPAEAFRTAAVGGQNDVDYGSWPDALALAPLPDDGALSAWHVWSWIYKKDDTFQVFVDGHEVQSGTIRWTLGGAEGAEALEVWFTFILSWGHTQIEAVNLTLPASELPIEYEIDYSRVYLR